MNRGLQKHIFWPTPSGVKRSNIIQFQLQRFLYQTLCLFSQIKDIKHIEQDFHSVAWVMPQGWYLGELGGGSKFNFSKHGHLAYQIEGKAK